MKKFYFNRFRPNRATEALRRTNAETTLNISEFIYPIFVKAGIAIKEPIEQMPGQFRFSVDTAVEKVEEIMSIGINKILLFGLPKSKTDDGSKAWDSSETIQKTITEIKSACPETTIITDVCLCEYTSHGHCGTLLPDGIVDNDSTLPLLARTAVSHGIAGADIVAPSAMMDGQVMVIRSALDEAHLSGTKIMGYSAKYASSFYGPFRFAAESSPKFGNRDSYQISTSQSAEAILEIQADIEEGADFVMVKPALAYLDIISKASAQFHTPLAAYNVSGEYSAIKAASAKGWIDERQAVIELITSIKRAGADLIITYFAPQIAQYLHDG